MLDAELTRLAEEVRRAPEDLGVWVELSRSALRAGGLPESIGPEELRPLRPRLGEDPPGRPLLGLLLLSLGLRARASPPPEGPDGWLRDIVRTSLRAGVDRGGEQVHVDLHEQLGVPWWAERVVDGAAVVLVPGGYYLRYGAIPMGGDPAFAPDVIDGAQMSPFYIDAEPADVGAVSWGEAQAHAESLGGIVPDHYQWEWTFSSEPRRAHRAVPPRRTEFARGSRGAPGAPPLVYVKGETGPGDLRRERRILPEAGEERHHLRVLTRLGVLDPDPSPLEDS